MVTLVAEAAEVVEEEAEAEVVEEAVAVATTEDQMIVAVAMEEMVTAVGSAKGKIGRVMETSRMLLLHWHITLVAFTNTGVYSHVIWIEPVI